MLTKCVFACIKICRCYDDFDSRFLFGNLLLINLAKMKTWIRQTSHSHLLGVSYAPIFRAKEMVTICNTTVNKEHSCPQRKVLKKRSRVEADRKRIRFFILDSKIVKGITFCFFFSIISFPSGVFNLSYLHSFIIVCLMFCYPFPVFVVRVM